MITVKDIAALHEPGQCLSTDRFVADLTDPEPQAAPASENKEASPE